MNLIIPSNDTGAELGGAIKPLEILKKPEGEFHGPSVVILKYIVTPFSISLNF